MTLARVVGPTAELTKAHQITLPAEICAALSIGPGDKVGFFPHAPGEYLFYVSTRPLALAGILPRQKRRRQSIFDMTHTYASMEREKRRTDKGKRSRK
ncbi:hypothetical protein CDN99_20965 [Roseateles aquatilis]|uniref:SpoVT-AbrB domain-containing protein n=1 Tax=Roseateles aquatilis TaxID=431061 RepID=A0A246J153_9BURK|nr:AbrB/MazE/SpoVT family DNA-binding domain-containing protein [Roseateles aquatilis]OWQ86306.1 hypothetical protein CDN99_20965 [Roseateles aquatilis]